jgi:hypothetical protein
MRAQMRIGSRKRATSVCGAALGSVAAALVAVHCPSIASALAAVGATAGAGGAWELIKAVYNNSPRDVDGADRWFYAIPRERRALDKVSLSRNLVTMSDGSKQSSEIRDPKALRALAHPLRWRLIHLVGAEGQATATRCAQVLRESVASCSYHLNMLARYGFVEVSPGGQGREKPWRLTGVRQIWAADADDVEGGLAAELVMESFLKVEFERLIEFERRRGIEPEPWRTATVTAGVTSFLTAEELRELGDALNDLACRYVDRLADRSLIPADARPVRIFIATSVAEERP